jgi:hypothetical protein
LKSNGSSNTKFSRVSEMHPYLSCTRSNNSADDAGNRKGMPSSSVRPLKGKRP